MSTVTRIDTPLPIADFIGAGPEGWAALGGRQARRWAGVGRGAGREWRQVWTFAVNLPGDVARAWGLAREARALLDKHNAEPLPHVGPGPLLTLARNVEAALGWRNGPDLMTTPDPAEMAFRQAIRDSPGDLASWAAYGDWLQDRGLAEGLTIARWLAPDRWSQRAAKEERDTALRRKHGFK